MRIAEQTAVYTMGSGMPEERTKTRQSCAPQPMPDDTETSIAYDRPKEHAAERKDTLAETHRSLANQAAQRVSASAQPILKGSLTGSHVELEYTSELRASGDLREASVSETVRTLASEAGQSAHAAAGEYIALMNAEDSDSPIHDAVRAAFAWITGNARDSGPAYAEHAQRLAETIRRSLNSIIPHAASRTARESSQGLGEETGDRVIQRGLEAAAALYASLVEQTAERTRSPLGLLEETRQMSPDGAASRILKRARLGERLQSSDLKYMAGARPDQVGFLSRLSSERDNLTKRMRQARSKSEVRMVHLGAVVTAGKTSVTAGEADSRINQLNDAKFEYMKTREYRKKPELPPKSLRRKPGEGQGWLKPASNPCRKIMRSKTHIEGGHLH